MNKFTRNPSHEHEHKPQSTADFASAGYRIAYSVSPKPATETAREDGRTLRSPSEKESVGSRFAAVFRQASRFSDEQAAMRGEGGLQKRRRRRRRRKRRERRV